MKRLLAALIASIALCAFAVPASAQTGAPATAPTTAPKSSSSKKKSSTMATPTPAPAPAMTCPPGKTMVKGYTKKDGTVVKPYCRKS
jgi:hypothetical protein